MMTIIRRHARKIKLAAVLLVILVICGVVGQMNARKELFKVCSDAFAWTDTDGSKGLDVQAKTVVQGTFLLDDSFVTLEFDYEIYGMESVPEDGNLHIEIRSAALPDNVLQWEFVPGTMENSGTVQIDLKVFKGQQIQISISCKGGFLDDSGVLLNNLQLSKLYIGA